MVSLTFVVSLGTVGARVGPWLRQFSDGQPLVQGQLSDQNIQALACTHFAPSRCVQHWGIVRGAGPAVAGKRLNNIRQIIEEKTSLIYRLVSKSIIHTQ